MAIAERMKELLEKYVQHLEKEKTHFKYELEADNPGITEAIEKSRNFENCRLKVSFLGKFVRISLFATVKIAWNSTLS